MSKLKFKECIDCKEWNGNRTNCANICSIPYVAWDGFNRYMELEEQGLLIRLPCKPNEEVWMGHDKHSLHKVFYASLSGIVSDLEDGYVIGRTREEAEAALAEMEK